MFFFSKTATFRLGAELLAAKDDTIMVGLMHLSALAALCLFSFGSATLFIGVCSCTVADAIRRIRKDWQGEVWPAAEAIGKAFCLYGILAVAVPLATLMPGPPALGRVSGAHLVLLAGLLIYQVFLHRRMKH